MFRTGNIIWNSVQDIGPCVNKALSFTLLVVMAPFFLYQRNEISFMMLSDVSLLPHLPRWWRQRRTNQKVDLNFITLDGEQRRYFYSQGDFYEIWGQHLRCWSFPLCFLTTFQWSQTRRVTKDTHAHRLKSTPSQGIAGIIPSLLWI